MNSKSLDTFLAESTTIPGFAFRKVAKTGRRVFYRAMIDGEPYCIVLEATWTSTTGNLATHVKRAFLGKGFGKSTSSRISRVNVFSYYGTPDNFAEMFGKGLGDGDVAIEIMNDSNTLKTIGTIVNVVKDYSEHEEMDCLVINAKFSHFDQANIFKRLRLAIDGALQEIGYNSGISKSGDTVYYLYIRNELMGNVDPSVGTLTEDILAEVAPPNDDIETWIKKNKKRFKDEYGEDYAQYLYGKAWNLYNKWIDDGKIKNTSE